MTLPYGAAAALTAAYTAPYQTPRYHTGSVEWLDPCPCGRVVLWKQLQYGRPTPQCLCQVREAAA